jgi:hypothetical protein
MRVRIELSVVEASFVELELAMFSRGLRLMELGQVGLLLVRSWSWESGRFHNQSHLSGVCVPWLEEERMP